MWVCVIMVLSRVQSRAYRYRDVVVVSEVIWSKENCKCAAGLEQCPSLNWLNYTRSLGLVFLALQID